MSTLYEVVQSPSQSNYGEERAMPPVGDHVNLTLMVKLVQPRSNQGAERKEIFIFPTPKFLDKCFVIVFNMMWTLYGVVQCPIQGNYGQERVMKYGPVHEHINLPFMVIQLKLIQPRSKPPNLPRI